MGTVDQTGSASAVRLMDVSGRQVGELPVHGLVLAASEDGRTLAVACQPDDPDSGYSIMAVGGTEVATVGLDGKSVRRLVLTREVTTVSNPLRVRTYLSLSPRGQFAAFQRTIQPGPPELPLVRPTNPKDLQVVVVAADGIESRVARWAGIDTTLGLKDIASCTQYHLTDIDIDPGRIELYYGSDLAHGGYAWVFPKGEHEANVGLGVVYNGRKSQSSAGLLDDFVRARFPEAHIIGVVVGAVPISGIIPRLSGGGIVAVGDAARLSDPLTGEGILNAMISGRIAGNVIADCVRKGDVTAATLRQYDLEVAKALGPALERNYILKEQLRKASDAKFSLLFRTARAMGVEKYPTSALLREAFSPKSRRAAAFMRLIPR
jgi:hypothetical protein